MRAGICPPVPSRTWCLKNGFWSRKCWLLNYTGLDGIDDDCWNRIIRILLVLLLYDADDIDLGYLNRIDDIDAF